MKVVGGDPLGWQDLGPTAVSIGVFDGVHLGHRRVLAGLVGEAREMGVIPAVLTFDPHPLEVLDPERAPLMLTTVAQRIEQFAALGIELVGVLPISQVRSLPPKEFARRVLTERLGARQVTVGADFRFGRGREGDASLLRELGSELGWTVAVVDMFGLRDGVVSSTLIRRLLLEGRVEKAADLLGRPFQLVGKVVAGDGRGKGLGYPTANLEVADNLVIPGDGIYAARAVTDSEPKPAAVNVGRRPTFGEGERVVEAHLLDFEGDLYGAELRLGFEARIRDELRFERVEDLVARIKLDVEETRRVLSA